MTMLRLKEITMKIQRKTQWTAMHADTGQEEVRVDSRNGETSESVVIIPTYNEAGNLKLLIPTILRQGPFDILIIDDNSPDGTGEVAERLAKRFPGRVSVLHRPGKLGLGTAYLVGFDYALAQGYQQVFTMDADFSHDPSRLPALREALEEADVVLGSRYVPGGGTQRWPLRRRLLSRGGSAYARLMLGLPIRDLTGGFKGFRRQVLEALLPELETIRSHGYAFQIEMTYRCARHGFRIVEVPILFEDRLVGTSKMSRRIVAEALWVVLALRLSQGPARPRTNAQPPARRARRRVLPVALALVVFLFVLGTVNFAPGWVAHVLRGTAEPATSLSHVPPAAAVQKRSRLAPVAPRVARSTPGASLQLAAALRRRGLRARGNAGGDDRGCTGAAGGTAGSSECRPGRAGQRNGGSDSGGCAPWGPYPAGARAKQSSHGPSRLPAGFDPAHGATGRLHHQARTRLGLRGGWFPPQRGRGGSPGQSDGHPSGRGECERRGERERARHGSADGGRYLSPLLRGPAEPDPVVGRPEHSGLPPLGDPGYLRAVFSDASGISRRGLRSR